MASSSSSSVGFEGIDYHNQPQHPQDQDLEQLPPSPDIQDHHSEEEEEEDIFDASDSNQLPSSNQAVFGSDSVHQPPSSNQALFGSHSVHQQQPQPNPQPANPWMVRFWVAAAVVVVTAIVLGVSLLLLHHKQHSQPVKDLCVLSYNVSDYPSISATVGATPKMSPVKVCVHLGEGTFYESVDISPDKKNLFFIGEGINLTIIASSNAQRTLWIRGQGFWGKDFTIVNHNGEGGVPVENWGYQTVLYRCKFESPGTSIHMQGADQFYREIDIYGGNYSVTGFGDLYFQRCNFYLFRYSSPGKFVFLGMTPGDLSQVWGFYIEKSNFRVVGGGDITASPTFIGGMLGVNAQLLVLQSSMEKQVSGYLDDSLQPHGAYIGVYNNLVQGSIEVPSYIHSLDKKVASEFSLRKHYRDLDWIPEGIYDLDL